MPLNPEEQAAFERGQIDALTHALILLVKQLPATTPFSPAQFLRQIEELRIQMNDAIPICNGAFYGQGYSGTCMRIRNELLSD